MKDINLDTSGAIMPDKIDKILLIDADTLAYSAASSCEYCEELLDRAMYSDKEWADIIADAGYSEKDHCVYGINLDEATQHAMTKIQLMLDKTGCESYELHFTVGRNSFRYTIVDANYKANRVNGSKRAPFGLYDLKVALTIASNVNCQCMLWEVCEADDAVWWLGDKYPDKYLVATVDKDILGAMKVEAFNYYCRDSYIHPKSLNKIKEIDMKLQTAEEPDVFWYYQCLTGDASDGIIGLKGVAEKTAKKILKNCTTDKERWDTIVAEYEKRGRSEIDALTNMRLVRLDQFNPETLKLKLWDPRELV